MYLYVIWPITYLFSIRLPNDVNKGNVFNNLVLHSVTEGKPRTSYVIRLIKSDVVKTSKKCIQAATTRSKNCLVFNKFLDNITSDNIILAKKIFIEQY